MTRDSFAARVRRGVEFLDETVNDDWHLRIDLDSLDLADGAHCVLGQLWEPKRLARPDADDWEPMENYDLATSELGLDLRREGELGFNGDTGDHFWLTIRWRQAIRNKIKETTGA